jgi:hypothetical protein
MLFYVPAEVWSGHLYNESVLAIGNTPGLSVIAGGTPYVTVVYVKPNDTKKASDTARSANGRNIFKMFLQ